MADTLMVLNLDDWKRIARIGHAASTDGERPILCGLYLALTGETLTAAATDSYGLAATKAKVEVEGPDTWDGIVPARQALQIEKDVRSLERYRSKKDTPDDQIFLAVTLGEESVEVTLDSDGSMFDTEMISRTIDLLDGAYPEWRSMIAEATEGGDSEVTMNSEILTKVLKTTGAEGITFRTSPGRKPVRLFAAGDTDWLAVVMPIAVIE